MQQAWLGGISQEKIVDQLWPCRARCSCRTARLGWTGLCSLNSCRGHEPVPIPT